MDTASLAEHFHQFFNLNLASTDALLADVQRLRYRVYCEEFGYEDKSRFPDRRERDDYDGIATHALITHKATGRAVASVRLIPATAAKLLPFEKNCARSYDENLVAAMPRSTMCEISRLSVDPFFRRRPGEATSLFGNYQNIDLSPKERRLLPFIGISLLLAGTALTFLTDRRNIFALMEPFLPRAMVPIGIEFLQIGRTIEYHGTRALYHVRSESVYEKMKPELKELFFSLYNDLKPHFRAAAAETLFGTLGMQAP
ncbi:MAG TPA: PEP-CTERM/exosortase system-associated acyltransferase [bacterium]|nr:PEP-CTERM/exosortase system-associated acyltransferase [bacterium]